MKLHLAQDEKVINRCIKNFEEVYPHNNKFVILKPYQDYNLKYVDNTDVVATTYNSKGFWETIGDISQYDSIILHSLGKDVIDFVLKINHPNIYWIEWGADLYVSLLYIKGYKLFEESRYDWRMSYVRLPYIIYKAAKWMSLKIYQQRCIRAVKKIKFFVPDSMYDEYPLLLKYYPDLKHLEYKEFYYYPVDEVVDKNLIDKPLGGNIVVGNSASVYANHRMVFKTLLNVDLTGRKVIVPLSYGNRNVSKYVSKIGSTMLGSRFYPVLNFMPLEEYNRLLLSASVFIYGNWRQEAVGNILAAIYLGGKVFLDDKNPLLDFYRKSGLTIFSISQLSDSAISSRLPDDVIIHNRRVLDNMYSREKQLKLIRLNF